jgi:hypothetical protein
MYVRRLIIISVLLAIAIALIHAMPEYNPEVTKHSGGSPPALRDRVSNTDGVGNRKVGFFILHQHIGADANIKQINLILGKIRLIGTIVGVNGNNNQAILTVNGNAIIRRYLNEEIVPGVTLRNVSRQTVIVTVGERMLEIKLADSRHDVEEQLFTARLGEGKKIEIDSAPFAGQGAGESDHYSYWTYLNKFDSGRSVTVGHRPGENEPQDRELDDMAGTLNDDKAERGKKSTLGKPAMVGENSEPDIAGPFDQ